MRWTTLLGFVGLLLAVPNLQAAVVLTTSSLSSTVITSAELQAPVVDWRFVGVPPGSMAPQLAATAVHLEVDSGSFLQTGTGSIGTGRPTTAASDHSGPIWRLGNWGNRSSLFIVPHGTTLTMTSGGLAVAVPELECLSQPLYIPTVRAAVCADLAQSIHVATTTTGFRMTGDFDAYLWGWQGTQSGADSETEFWTGARSSTPQLPGVPTGPSERRFAKLAVTGGELDVAAPTAKLDIFPSAANIVSPQASLGGTGFVAASDAVATITRSDQALGLVLQSGSLTDADGHTTVVDPPGGREPLLWFWLGGGLALPAIVSWWAARPSRLVHRAANNLAIGNPGAAYRHARLAARYPWTRRKALTLSAISLLKAGRWPEAERLLAFARVKGHLAPAACDFLESFLQASRGRTGEARSLLQRSLAADPALHAEAMANKVLRPLVGDELPPRGELS